MTLLEFADFLREHPKQPVKVLADMLDCHPKNVQKFLAQLEVKETRGCDPVNGRKNVKLYEICLPKEKRKAVAK